MEEFDQSDLVGQEQETDTEGNKSMNKVQIQRRVSIPESMLKSHGIDVGDKVLIEDEGDKITLQSVDEALK